MGILFKRKAVLAAALVLSLGAAAQVSVRYYVKGKVPAGVEKVYLLHPETGLSDSTTVENGVFSFDGSQPEPAFALLRASGETIVPLYLNGDSVVVDWDAMTLKGSTENAEISRWLKEFKPYFDMNKQFVAEVKALREGGQDVPDSVRQRVMMTGQLLANNLVKTTVRCCDEGKNSVVPAVFLYMNWQLLSEDELLAVGADDRKYMAAPMLKEVRARMESLRRRQVGTMFTDLEMTDTTGVVHKLSEYVGRGNYVLIDFWASWCGPCRAEMPAVKAAYERFAPKGFQIVGLSFDQNAAAWKAGIKKLGLTWPQLSDLKGRKSIAGQTYGIHSIPMTLLVGPDGKIVASGLRGEALSQKLEEIYK